MAAVASAVTARPHTRGRAVPVGSATAGQPPEPGAPPPVAASPLTPPGGGPFTVVLGLHHKPRARLDADAYAPVRRIHER